MCVFDCVCADVLRVCSVGLGAFFGGICRHGWASKTGACCTVCESVRVCAQIWCALVVWVWVRCWGVSVGVGGSQRQVCAALYVCVDLVCIRSVRVDVCGGLWRQHK